MLPAERASELIDQLQRSNAPLDEITEELIDIGLDGTPALFKAIQSGHAPSQSTAVIVLSRLDSRRALATILNGIVSLTDKPDLCSTLLFKAATLLTPQDKERVRPLLVQSLRHNDPGVRLATIECVRAVQDEGLMTIIREQASKVHEAHTVPNPNTQNTVPRAASLDLIDALGSEDQEIRQRAVAQLIEHPDRRQIISAHLHHANPRIRVSVLEAAWELQSPEWRKALVDIGLNQDRSAQERIVALQGVKQLDEDSLVAKQLQSLFEHENVQLQTQGARLLTTSRQPELRRLALERLNVSQLPVRTAIIGSWTASAGASYQYDLPTVIGVLDYCSWLRQPSAADVENLQTLCAGIARVIELGAFIQLESIDAFAKLRFGTTQEVRELIENTLNIIAESTGIYSTFHQVSVDLSGLFHPLKAERLKGIQQLAAAEPLILQKLAGFIVEQLYTAGSDEMVEWLSVLKRTTDPRAKQAIARLKQHSLSQVQDAIRALGL